MVEQKLSRESKPRERITLDTVIPSLPDKSERLLPPDEERHDQEIKALDLNLNKLRERKKNIKDQIKEKKEGGKINNSSVSVRVFIDENFRMRKEKVEQIKKLKNELELLKREFFVMVDDQKKLRLRIKVFDRAKTEEKIALIQNKIEGTTLTLQEEKKLISELSSLQASLPLISQHTSRSKKIDENKTRQETLKAQITSLNEEIEQITAIIEQAKSQKASSKEERSGEIPLLIKEEKDLENEIKALKADKKKFFEEFKEKRFAFNKQQNEIKQIEWMTKIKNRLIEQDKRKKLLETEKTQRVIQEINKCDVFISFLSKFILKDAQEQEKQENLCQKTELMIKESKEFFGKVEKKHKKKGKFKKIKKIDLFSSDQPIDLLNFFSIHNIKVPISVEEVKESINQLQRMKQEWMAQDMKKPEADSEIFETFSDRKTSEDLLNPINSPRDEKTLQTTNSGKF